MLRAVNRSRMFSGRRTVTGAPIAAALLAGLLLFSGSGDAAPAAISGPYAGPTLPPYNTINFTTTVNQTNLSYYEWLPPNYTASVQYPIAIFLHGQGQSPLELTTLHGGQSAINAAQSYGYILIAPNTRTPAGFYVNSPFSGPQEHDVIDAILHEEHLRHEHRPTLFVFGSSMGSTGAYSLASHHPKMFRGVGAISGCPDAFEATYYRVTTGAGTWKGYVSTTHGLLPNQSAYSYSQTYYLSAARYYPTNFSNTLVYGAQGGNDHDCPNNPAIWPYQNANDTFLNSTCQVVLAWSQPANCTTPLSNLSAAFPGLYSWRFDYTPTGYHSLNELNGADMFAYWSGKLAGGLVCSRSVGGPVGPC